MNSQTRKNCSKSTKKQNCEINSQSDQKSQAYDFFSYEEGKSEIKVKEEYISDDEQSWEPFQPNEIVQIPFRERIALQSYSDYLLSILGENWSELGNNWDVDREQGEDDIDGFRRSNPGRNPPNID